MQFEVGYIYHIYNQGNNRQKIFFIRENYLFFLKKIRKYILPYADIMAWCLMPNHFHFMILVKSVKLPAETKNGEKRPGVSLRHTGSDTPLRLRTFNDSIGIMLMAYTKAVNKQQDRRGKLFREETKAGCVNCFKGLTPNFITKHGITQNNRLIPETQYPQVLFNYIHQNPVRAGLVKHSVDWEFSSARDYSGMRNGKLINKRIAKKYLIL